MIRKKTRRKSTTKTVRMPMMVTTEILLLIRKMVAIETMVTATIAGPRTWWSRIIAQDNNTSMPAT